jgi:dsRNA-specific ribonuclease
LLSLGNLKPKYIEELLSTEGMKSYSIAFTAESADKHDNYERFEQLGDISANKFIVWYMYKRFPQLDCTEGVKVVARLRINYGAKNVFAPIAEKYGFGNFISGAIDGEDKKLKYLSKNRKDLLEDTFEAFIGCTEYLLDKKFRIGVGYSIVYDILTAIFDDLPISLKYEDLYDAVTRLKETVDMMKAQGKNIEIKYEESKVPIQNSEYDSNLIKVFLISNGQHTFIGESMNANKGIAKQQSAQIAIDTLKKKFAIYKEPPALYSYFCT